MTALFVGARRAAAGGALWRGSAGLGSGLTAGPASCGGSRFAGLPCGARAEVVPENSLRGLTATALKQLRQVSQRCALRAPTSTLCFSASTRRPAGCPPSPGAAPLVVWEDGAQVFCAQYPQHVESQKGREIWPFSLGASPRSLPCVGGISPKASALCPGSTSVHHSTDTPIVPRLQRGAKGSGVASGRAPCGG